MMSVWQISREYAGLAEAGGVKNVVTALCEELSAKGHDVTLFIPLYGCTSLNAVADFDIVPDVHTCITVSDRTYRVSFGKARVGVVPVIFVISSLFTEKMGVYTYTELEERIAANKKRGSGHADAICMEMVFQKAVVLYAVLSGTAPDLIHCHDATTAFIPALARTQSDCAAVFERTAFMVTIHNAGPAYHHEISSLEDAVRLTCIDRSVLEKGVSRGRVEPYLVASAYACMTTVSPWYAEEMTDPWNPDTDGLSAAFAGNGTRIHGITNGIEFDRYDPKDVRKSLLPFAYNPENADLEGKYRGRKLFFELYGGIGGGVSPTAEGAAAFSAPPKLEQHGFLAPVAEGHQEVLFTYQGRIAHQKGLDVLLQVLPTVLGNEEDIRFIIAGQGESDLENGFARVAEGFPGRCLYLRGYERSLARLCVSVADFIVLPSYFEPCGLEDFIAALLGTIPIAHATGGLKKILHGKTGFLYPENTGEWLGGTLLTLVEEKKRDPHCYDSMIQYGAQYVRTTYSWKHVLEREYLPLYEKCVNGAQTT